MTCRHRDTWIIAGGAWEWCYRCGALRQLRPLGPTSCTPASPWARPVGTEGGNPFEAWARNRRDRYQITEAQKAAEEDPPLASRVPVVSSNISSIGFSPYAGDPVSGFLDVEFRSGAIYRYRDVPKTVYAALLGAPSIGSRFAALVKAAGYQVEIYRKAGG